MASYPQERIRNFSIIAHVDHGKSTLADRLLELSGTIVKSQENQQVLDKLQVERERGITVKAQTASMFYTYKGVEYLINLIDTPGHVDFHYEVSRSLSACQGVVLLVDANQGVQAQTVANFFLAFERDLVIIPVMNKIDLKVAKPEVVEEQLRNVFDFDQDEILRISAKTGLDVDKVLHAVIERIPPPAGDASAPLKALIFDSWYKKYIGTVCNIAVVDGTLKHGDSITLHHAKKTFEVKDVGIMFPNEVSTTQLQAGQVGYMHAGIRQPDDARVGDTVCSAGGGGGKLITPLEGFKPAKPMVFAGVFPLDQSEYNDLRSALDKLTLNDPSVDIRQDSSASLGAGFRLGFLGLLHMDVFQQRLEQEYNASVITTSPNVPYRVTIVGAKNIKHYQGEELEILNPSQLPPMSIVSEMQEPMVLGTIISPTDYTDHIAQLIRDRRGVIRDESHMDQTRVMVKALLPLSEVVIDFFDELKSKTKGYASFDYEDAGFQVANLVKIDVFMNDRLVDEMSLIAHESKAQQTAKRVVAKLHNDVPRQLIKVVIQAKVNNKVIARADIKAFRKDVTAKCYGGDVTRKQKLLKAQADGKKRMRSVGNVKIPKEAFINIMRK